MTALTLEAANIARGHLILVNADHPARHEPAAEGLAAVCVDTPDIRLEGQAAAMLAEAMVLVGCKREIVPVSGYRPRQEQERIYQKSLRTKGETFTRQYVALPGCSEHQTGLAIDLAQNKDDIDFIRPALPYTGIFGRFRQAARRCGFIERYPAGSEDITGIAHEPWHFRYVGPPHAAIMHEEGLTLEEYTAYLRDFPHDSRHLRRRSHNGEFEIFHVTLPGAGDAGDIEVELPDHTTCDVSGNNDDGAVVTLRRS